MSGEHPEYPETLPSMTTPASAPTSYPDDGRNAEVAAFAAELRAMRTRAGSPSLRTIAAKAHFSISTLSEATAGRRLPTEPVVRALATACGEDPGLWADRLRDTVARLEAAPAQSDSHLVVTPSAPGRLRRLGGPGLPRSLAVTCAATIAAFAAGYAVAPGTGATGATAAVHPASDGDSPVTAGCVPDAHLVDKTPLLKNSVQVGALELEYSAACHAGWARVYLYPAGVAAGLSTPGGPVATVWVTAADGTATAYAARLDHQQPDYTDVVTPHGGCIRASASLVEAGEPPLEATITCDDPLHVPVGASSTS